MKLCERLDGAQAGKEIINFDYRKKKMFIQRSKWPSNLHPTKSMKEIFEMKRRNFRGHSQRTRD